MRFLARSLLVVTAPLTFSAAFWIAFAAMIGCFGCITVDEPLGPPDPIARVFAYWDPLVCASDPPTRVAIDLEDDDGAPLVGSAPCAIGRVTLEASHYGRYRGRTYAFLLGAPARSEARVDLTIDAPVVHWQLVTPP